MTILRIRKILPPQEMAKPLQRAAEKKKIEPKVETPEEKTEYSADDDELKGWGSMEVMGDAPLQE